ncbi:MAG: type III secretion system ATPase SctN [Chlamydiota bacterium]|nr:type III secretion system ATPase SctN [Chlamydiota bacterium]
MSRSFKDLSDHLDAIDLTTVNGRIIEIVGMLIKAVVPNIKVGEVCAIKREGAPLMAEVVGFTRDAVLLSPFGEMQGIGPSSEVVPTRSPLKVKVGMGLLGRVIDAMGNPLDEEEKGPLNLENDYPVISSPPSALKRGLIEEPLPVGIKAIDGLLTCGRGQRMGIFAAAGGGKSTLLGMIARNAQSDINVITLIGERGRELREFIKNDLGEEGLSRSVVVVSTSDQAAQLRLNAAYVGTAIAEYFRDQGKDVVLMMDSVTRFARALREVGLAAGEPPARSGYTPSVFSTLPRLLERSGNSECGSITGFYTILVAGDDMNEPVADETRSILDGHIILSSELAQQYHYPAIDVPASLSRLFNTVTSRPHQKIAGKIRSVLANYKKNELLIRIGEYEKGSDPEADFAIHYIEGVNRFLKQDVEEKISFEKTLNCLQSLFS